MNATHDERSNDSAAGGPGPSPGPATPPRPATGLPPPIATGPRVAAGDPRAKMPGLACCLSLMPGLGQVYVGYYLRGFIHALVVAGLITLLASGDLDELTPLAGFFLAFFWLYNVIDAGRRASLYNQMLAGSERLSLPADFEMPGTRGSMAGGLFLIGLGVLLLLHVRFGLALDWLADWWPLVPIGIGVYLLVKAVQERPGSPPERH